MKPRTGRSGKRGNIEIGWRETVGLPDFGIAALRAKIDTGARTSALHATDLQIYEHDGMQWVDFHILSPNVPQGKRCAARVVDERQIMNTSGVTERRCIIETTLVLGKRHWKIEVSLADREKMAFDLILGRTAIRRHRLLVNPGRSYLAGTPVEISTPDTPLLQEGLLRTLKCEQNQAYNVADQGDE